MVIVSVSETYDLSTKVGKMALIGIHTPSREIITKTYPGLCLNSKFCRIVKQDVSMACASLLPADPLQVGVETGDIAPQDMFNPILYKAVSNDSMSTLEYRLAGLTSASDINGESLIKSDNFTGLEDDFNTYYALLSNRDGFRTAAPQAGLSLKGLVPLVFDRYYNYGVNQFSNPSIVSDNPQDDKFNVITDLSQGLGITQRVTQSMRGRAHPMPKFNTTYLTSTVDGIGNGMGDQNPVNTQRYMPDIMPVYTAAIVMPPCKLNQLFYRMTVRTYIEFSEVRPIQEVTSFAQMNTNYAPLVYQSDYEQQSTVMSVKAGMVDASEAVVQKIMEGA